MVSVPYEITLLSNYKVVACIVKRVSVPYEITLLSNLVFGCALVLSVSVPYEITLLSNKKRQDLEVFLFQYLMKLHYSQTLTIFVT